MRLRCLIRTSEGTGDRRMPSEQKGKASGQRLTSGRAPASSRLLCTCRGQQIERIQSCNTCLEKSFLSVGACHMLRVESVPARCLSRLSARLHALSTAVLRESLPANTANAAQPALPPRLSSAAGKGEHTSLHHYTVPHTQQRGGSVACERKAIRDLSTQCDGPQGCASTGSATSGGARPADHGLGSHSQANTRRQNATTRRHGLAKQVCDLSTVCVDPTPHRGSLGLPLSLVCDAPWPDLHASGCVCCPTIATIMAFLNRITVLQVLLFAVGIVVVGTIPAQGQDLH